MRTILIVAGLLAWAGASEAATPLPTCTDAKRTCLQLGSSADACDARWRACMQTACWVSGPVRRCGYVKR